MNERLEQARKTVKHYMWWSMGAGLIPIPIIDITTITAVQLKMLSKLSEHYNISFSKDRVKAVVGSLISTLSAAAISKGVLGSAIKTVPIVGHFTAPFIMPTVCAALTYSIGIVFIQHFESGGTFLDFNPEKTREFFKAQFDEKMNALK